MRGHPFAPGAKHPSAKLTARVVIAARRQARRRSMPKGWISELAKRHGVTVSAVVSAIGGQSWKHLQEPPVDPWRRVRKSQSSRRICPSCGKPKYAKGCRAIFHKIDHRGDTSARNLRRGR